MVLLFLESKLKSVFSKTEALDFLKRHGVNISSSTLTTLSNEKVIKCVLTDGGHRRYEKDELVSYAEYSMYIDIWIQSCDYDADLAVSKSAASALDKENMIAWDLMGASYTSLYHEITGRISHSNNVRSVNMGFSPSPFFAPFITPLLSYSKENGVTISFCNN